MLASEEYRPTAPSPIVNFELSPNFTLASPSVYIPIVVPAFVPVPLAAISIGAFIFNAPAAFFAYIPTAFVPTLIFASVPSCSKVYFPSA